MGPESQAVLFVRMSREAWRFARLLRYAMLQLREPRLYAIALHCVFAILMQHGFE